MIVIETVMLAWIILLCGWQLSKDGEKYIYRNAVVGTGGCVCVCVNLLKANGILL
jgi:hypothetical protein